MQKRKIRTKRRCLKKLLSIYLSGLEDVEKSTYNDENKNSNKTNNENRKRKKDMGGKRGEEREEKGKNK